LSEPVMSSGFVLERRETVGKYPAVCVGEMISKIAATRQIRIRTKGEKRKTNLIFGSFGIEHCE